MTRFWRWLTVLMLTGAAATAAAPVRAVGTGGIELTPIPAETARGKPVTSFRARLASGEKKTLQFLLRNVVTSPATAEIYAASASRSPEGRFAVGGAGSAPWIGLARQSVTLAPREQRVVTFTVARDGAPKLPVAYGAILVQVERGAVVERAATIVVVTRAGPDRTVPILLGASAGLLLLIAGVLVVSRARAARRDRAVSRT